MENQNSSFQDNPSFQGVSRPFALSFQYVSPRESHKRYFSSTIKIKDYNLKIDGRNIFGQLVKKYIKNIKH